MDLENAVQVHAQWKVKLRTAITKQEGLDAKVIGVDNACELGKWLHGDAKGKYGKLASYTECVSAHAAFHKAAGQVAQVITDKKYDEAIKMLENGTSFAKASTAVGVALGKLKKEAKL